MRIKTTVTVSLIGDNGREITRHVSKVQSNVFSLEGQEDRGKVTRNVSWSLSHAGKHAKAALEAVAASILG